MEIMDLNKARIFVSTYANSLWGEWVELSDFYNLDDFRKHCAKIHEDYIYQSWENIPNILIDRRCLEKNFFELREALEQLTDTEKNAFWVWVRNTNANLFADIPHLTRSFQSDYIGHYADKEIFAKEEFIKAENELPDFALIYFDFSKYADDLFCTDFWYKDGYVFRNN